MEAIRQYLKVNGRTLEVILPDDFVADEVEVIILSTNKHSEIPQWQMDQVQERTEAYIKNPSSGRDFDEAIKDIENGL